ncbi:DNA-binding response regulator [Terasakiella brassicae]|uniref:Phosphate regulon transcriptional regulatory protein PhoB n=1 Tax=Terasakiella brassicae TaxID=1634917 RepID=A0A917BNX1_9PROT|nr:phosphate regulon transcriptional regulator PhoB [Terasakiella brassicae]GGF51307.1 DNA-binding response regulator [Terasakiella brassicae]
MEPLVLIVEDEPPLAELVRYNIEKEGFRTLCVGDGEEAMLLVEEEEPDLVILDWMLPGLSGIEVCRRLRERKSTKSLPIIMLTARGEESDRIRGLDSGADDYIVKPFSPNELLARAKAVLRRSSPALAQDKLSYEDISMDLTEHKVLRDEIPVHLGPTEYRLLRVLMERPGRVFSREQLLDKVWGRDIHVEVRTVDVHIRRLRKALSINDRPDFIRTVRAAGYSLDSTV